MYVGMCDLWNSSLSSVRCDLPDHIQSLPKIFRKDYNLSYSSFLGEDDHKLTQICLRPHNSLDPSFESIFSFENDSPQLFLLSASYSYDLVARPGCFVNWTEVFDPEDGKGCAVRISWGESQSAQKSQLGVFNLNWRSPIRIEKGTTQE